MPSRNNYWQSIGEATFLLGRLIKPLGRVSMVMLQRGVRIFVFLLVSCKQVSLQFYWLPGSLVHFSPTFEGFPKYSFSHLKRRVKRLTKTNTQTNKITLVLTESVNRNFNNCRTMKATGDRTCIVTKTDFDIIAILPNRLHH